MKRNVDRGNDIRITRILDTALVRKEVGYVSTLQGVGDSASPDGLTSQLHCCKSYPYIFLE